jgi:3-oxoacyl-[acyl-carrier-protein] synthase-1
MTVGGFSALGVTSTEHCRPFSRSRKGINIGEAGAAFIMSRDAGPWQLLGAGESSDAHHISAPEPEGRGAERAMLDALDSAGIQAEDVDYINFHGTATAQNDRMEALATSRVFQQTTACGSTKALTGHTLGAAGALEALFCLLTLERNDGQLPQHAWDGDIDDDLPDLPGLAVTCLGRPANIAMSNSFAFGGNNLSLIFARSGL